MSTPKKRPLLRVSWTGVPYIITGYRVRGVSEGRQAVTAITKHQVPDAEFEEAIREYRKAKRRSARHQ